MIEAALMEIIFDTIKPDARDGDKAMFSSGYGSGPIVIDVRELAQAIIDRREDWTDGRYPYRPAQ